MYHTTLQPITVKLLFGIVMIKKTPLIADWEAMRLQKKKIIDMNNQLKNQQSKQLTYTILDKVLVLNKKENKYEEPYIGPNLITQCELTETSTYIGALCTSALKLDGLNPITTNHKLLVCQ